MAAPFYGCDSCLGTNPFCVVLPCKNTFPLLLDYATSVTTFGKTRVTWHKGGPVAPGCPIDVAGVPTIDPVVMQVSPLGSLLTFAEYKGYALAAICETMDGVLSGDKTTYEEGPQTNADAIINRTTTIVVNPQLFGAPNCGNQVTVFSEWVETSPYAENAPILLPGEWEVNTHEERLEYSIPLDAGSWQAICEAAL